MILLLLIGVVSLFVSHQWKQPQQDFSHTLKVLTYNTHALCMGNKQQARQMLAYLNKQDADIICLQEVRVYKDAQRMTLNQLRQAMSQYPYTYYDFKRYNSRRQFGNVVFSRYPLINKQTISYESQNNISSQCDVVVKEDTIRLIVNHLESFRLMKEDLQLDTLSVSHFKQSSLNQKLHAASELRQEQAKAVKEAINHSPYPVIAVGDFNSIPLSYVYGKISWGMRDCFLEGSFGRLGNTYKTGPFGIRIDYILCSKELTPIKSKVDRVTYSDHFPVCATIGW
ncbi:MAG: endonuclease/exonuclease/phosphatase family protein [Paludibacteraceae bacterium]|nr:endonuclease/exonuclease/phosphatase family protein [Paludibacteraceae bacterium]